MGVNVLEWVEDWSDEDKRKYKVICGHSYYGRMHPDNISNAYFGFRCAR